jgi:predicted metallo-beta-lactamase superfamily hydrolase
MGSRSMATFVETGDINILVDPGANIGAYRYGLSPHPLEKWCMKKHLERIRLYARSADAVIITHYHFDHFIPDEVELYRGKILLIKNPNQDIHIKQRKRAFAFIRSVGKISSEIHYMDGKTLDFGSTKLIFSPPVPHGETDLKGFVIEVVIQKGEKTFLFSSDVLGPCNDQSMDFILQQNPNMLYLDGPLTYLQENDSSKESLDKTLQRLRTIIDKTNIVSIIIDHHLTRDINWREKINSFFKYGQRKAILIQTAAQFRGEEDNLLEARRTLLYESESQD